MKKNKLIKLSGIIGAFLFAVGMMIDNSTTVIANDGAEGFNPECNGSGIQCVSHLPERFN